MDQGTWEGMGQVIDGKAIAAEVRRDVRERVMALVGEGKRPPGLAIVRVGDDPASKIYVRNKSRACAAAGIAYRDVVLPENVPFEDLLDRIGELNLDDTMDGVLVQLPLPEHLRDLQSIVTEWILETKDVDGFHPKNLGRILTGGDGFVPCTPLGIMELINRTGVSLEGARAVVVGRSVTVGKPVAALLLNANATVIHCHSRTRDLEAEVREADVLVAAAGHPHLIKGDWIKPGAIVIDVGINRVGEHLVGDVDFDTARKRAAFITPVPGGVGPMTVAMLLRNTLQARELHD